MPLFYKPAHARVSDVIPFFDSGQINLFYLKNWNPYFGADRADGWHRLETGDLIHFRETPVGIRGGTGCVLKVDGIYHMFYCKFEHSPQRQYVWHATSLDLENWTELPDEAFGPDERYYLLTDWRDPHVLWNEEEKRWWVILCAQARGTAKRRGCVALCTSDDLSNWVCRYHCTRRRKACPDTSARICFGWEIGGIWCFLNSQTTFRPFTA